MERARSHLKRQRKYLEMIVSQRYLFASNKTISFHSVDTDRGREMESMSGIVQNVWIQVDLAHNDTTKIEKIIHQKSRRPKNYAAFGWASLSLSLSLRAVVIVQTRIQAS